MNQWLVSAEDEHMLRNPLIKTILSIASNVESIFQKSIMHHPPFFVDLIPSATEKYWKISCIACCIKLFLGQLLLLGQYLDE